MKYLLNMKYLIISIITVILLSVPVFAIELNINKDTPNTELVVVSKGFGYKTIIQTEEDIILNIPSNIEIISTSLEPTKVVEETISFLIFTLYKGKKLYFENTTSLEVVFRYEGGPNQFSTNLYSSIKSLYS